MTTDDSRPTTSSLLAAGSHASQGPSASPGAEQVFLDRLLTAGAGNLPASDGRPVLIEAYLTLAIDLAAQLQGYHQQGVVHGQVNPAHILIEHDASDSPSYGQATIVGPGTCEARNVQLAYVSPEQTGRMNRVVDHRTDLYSLGVVLYQVLTGQLPFKSTDPLALVHAHIATKPTPLVLVRADLPVPVSDIVVKLLAKDPRDRYQSAYGLQADLETCLERQQSTGWIEPFALGQKDVSDRFLLPQAVVGRDRELDRLLRALDESRSGVAQLLCVSGESGVGKTTLVSELAGPVSVYGGAMIAGRPERDRQSVPFAAVVAALEDFVRQLLAGDPVAVALWRDRLQEALSGNTAQLIRNVPGLRPLLDITPDETSESSDPKLLLSLALQSFLRAITTPDHPLVIFLDDAQWADEESVALLHSLTEQESLRLLVICAYRPDESLSDTLRKVISLLPADRQLALAPLDLAGTAGFLAEALHTTTEQVGDLPALLHGRTGGNPFFLGEFLLSLRDRGLLFFDPKVRAWRWDLAQVEAAPITSNIVELVRVRLEQLPLQTQTTLKVAALMGTQVEVGPLAVACQRTLVETKRDLGLALELGALAPLAHHLNQPFPVDPNAERRLAAMQQMASQFLVPSNEDLVPPSRDRSPSPESGDEDAVALANTQARGYQFVHEQVREAAVSLVPSLAEETIHYQIGRRLLQGLTPGQRQERIFSLVRHLNKVSALVVDWPDRVELAELNLAAGRQALALGAEENAYSLAMKGVAILQEDLVSDGWQDAQGLMRDLHLTAAHAATRGGQFEQAEYLLAAVDEHATSALDRAATTQVRMFALYLQGRHKEAVVAAVKALRPLGVRLPERPGNRHLLAAMARTRLSLLGRRIETLTDLPPMTDERCIKALEILATASISAASVEPKLLMIIGLEIVRQTVKHGFAPLSAMGYALHGLLLCGIIGQINPGHAFGELALQLAPQIRSNEYRVFVKYFAYAHIKHWKDHVRTTLQPLRDLTTTGEFEYLAVAAGLYSYFTWFIHGMDIEANERSIAENLHLLEPFRDTPLYYRYVLGQQYYQNLLGRSADPCQMVGEAYDERQLLPVHLRDNDRTTIFYMACHKLILCCLFQDFDRAQDAARLAVMYADAGVGTPLVPVRCFYHSLACLGRYPTASLSEARQLARTVAANQRRMRKWSRYGPANCAHRYTLVEAERARVRGETATARELYDRAIGQAQDHDYLMELALAHELAARFYLSGEQPAYAETHLRAAHRCYHKWGALAKVRQIESTYPQWFLDDAPGLANLSAYLDMASVLKTAQVLSSETTLPGLLETLTQILVENAGAERGYLLLPAGDQWQVAAGVSDRASSDEPDPDAPNRPALAMSIVHQVAATGEPLLLNDVAASTAFARDPHLLARHPGSILCLPLLDRGELVGVFYMENRLTRDAFPPDRLQPLTMLAIQAAISLKNASLVAGLQEAQDKVLASEQRFRLLFENAPLGIFEIDISHATPKILAANRRAEAAYGWSAGELVDQDPGQLTPDESRHEIQRLIETVRSGKTALLETTNRRKDGTLFPVRVIATPAQDPHGLRMIVAVEDITAQRQRRSEAEAIDEERRRIAREIHDGVAQDLASLRLKLSLWRDWVASDPERMQDELDQTQVTLDAAIDEIRRSIYALRPVALDEVGLLVALRRYVADFNDEHDVYVDLQIDVQEKSVPAHLELPLFRVVQEALNNAVQHAEASLAWVRLDTSDGETVNLTICDNGRGFDLTVLSGAGRSGHLGLVQMRERIEQAGGQLTMASQPGSGTEIQVRLSLG